MEEVKKNKGGRPKLEIDTELLRELAMMHCTVEEIAAHFRCSRETIYARFSDVLREGKEDGKCSLRRLMWKSANAGNIHMQIWLSKQLLGYRDKQPDEIDTNIVYNVNVKEIPK
jgi:hypothetical protein